MEATAMADNTASFETEAVGATPKGWTATITGRGNAKWTVEPDQTAPSKSKVIKQSGVATYPLLLKDDTNIKDGFIEVKFKAIDGSEDRAAGLVWRARDANNYSAPTRSRTTSFSTRPSAAYAARLTLSAVWVATESTLRSRQTNGIPCASISKAAALGCSIMANSYSRWKIQRSPTLER
jgi:hypothetical protein